MTTGFNIGSSVLPIRLGVLMCLFLIGAARADSIDWLSDDAQSNLRFAVDLSARATYAAQVDDISHVEFVGIDVLKVLTGEQGDIGTLTLQPYLTRINNVGMPSSAFADGNDWALIYRIFNFNYMAQSRGALNIRIGHFEIPYGLEQTINTNGTLRDYTHKQNFGLKADWGATVNGQTQSLEYEIGISRGAGNNWESKGDPYIVAGRVGTQRDAQFVVGFSALQGDVFNETVDEFVVERSRVGFDAQWYIDRFGLLGEVSVGEDDDEDVLNGLVELDYFSRDDGWLIYAQLARFARDSSATGTQRTTTLNLGFKIDINRYWDVSGQWTNDLAAVDARQRRNLYTLQARWRY